VKELVEQLLESPTLPEALNELEARMAEERARREKFYEELADEKAEFINGEIIVDSPNKIRHLEVRDNLHELVRTFVRVRNLGFVAGEKALCVFPRNDYMPDVCYFRPEKAAQLRPDQMKLPIPDFIAEVLSETTTRKDRGQKFRDYQAHGVQEYWLIDLDQEILEQYVLKGSTYELVQKSGTGEVRSTVVTGVVIPVRALFDAEVQLATLRGLLAI
jgi:Uma2 family endonuclease